MCVYITKKYLGVGSSCDFPIHDMYQQFRDLNETDNKYPVHIQKNIHMFPFI